MIVNEEALNHFWEGIPNLIALWHDAATHEGDALGDDDLVVGGLLVRFLGENVGATDPMTIALSVAAVRTLVSIGEGRLVP